jgi:hypothetical protein
VLSSQVVNSNLIYTNSVPVAAFQETGWNVREAWAVMHFIIPNINFQIENLM